MNSRVTRLDQQLIRYAKQNCVNLAQWAFFVIYTWFGVLKMLGLSPAGPLVLALVHRTMPFFSDGEFLFWLGLFEIVIGLCFLLPNAMRLAIALLAVHLVMTALPLFILPELTWSGFLIPTMEGQYIIKNVLMVALAANVSAKLKPYCEREKNVVKMQK